MMMVTENTLVSIPQNIALCHITIHHLLDLKFSSILKFASRFVLVSVLVYILLSMFKFSKYTNSIQLFRLIQTYLRTIFIKPKCDHGSSHAFVALSSRCDWRHLFNSQRANSRPTELSTFQGLPCRSRSHYFWPSLSHAYH